MLTWKIRGLKLPHSSEKPQVWTNEARALLTLGAPMALTQLIQFSVNTIDVLMIARIGPEALAAAALGQVVYITAFLFCLGPVMAVSPMVSQSIGANAEDHKSVRCSVRMGLWAIGILFPFVLLLFGSTPYLAKIFGQPPVAGQLAAPYVLSLAPGWAAFMGVSALRNFLAAIGRTRFPLYVIASATLLNALLNYILIFGKLGAPALGLLGAGIASSIANCFAFIALAIFCYHDPRARPFDILKDFASPDWMKFREVIRLGVPISVTTTFEGFLFNAAVFLMGRIGLIEVASFQVAINFAALIFMIPLGFSMGGSIRVGLHAGASRPHSARRAAVLTILISALLVTPISCAAFFAPTSVANAYLFLNVEGQGDRSIIPLTALFIRLAAAFMIFDAIQVAANQSLRGLKDVRAPMMICAVAYWMIGFPVAVVLSGPNEFGPQGVWYGLILGLLVSAIALSWRLHLRTKTLIAEKGIEG